MKHSSFPSKQYPLSRTLKIPNIFNSRGAPLLPEQSGASLNHLFSSVMVTICSNIGYYTRNRLLNRIPPFLSTGSLYRGLTNTLPQFDKEYGDLSSMTLGEYPLGFKFIIIFRSLIAFWMSFFSLCFPKICGYSGRHNRSQPSICNHFC